MKDLLDGEEFRSGTDEMFEIHRRYDEPWPWERSQQTFDEGVQEIVRAKRPGWSIVGKHRQVIAAPGVSRTVERVPWDDCGVYWHDEVVFILRRPDGYFKVPAVVLDIIGRTFSAEGDAP